MDNYRLSQVSLNDTGLTDHGQANAIQRFSRNHHFLPEVIDELGRLGDADLERNATAFAKDILHLPEDEAKEFARRAPYLARDPVIWYQAAHDSVEDGGGYMQDPRVQMNPEEKRLLREERDKLFSQPGILIVRTCISLAGFLQGAVQASLNSSSMYTRELRLERKEGSQDAEWKLGFVNSMPFFAAALLGCWLSLPINDRFGRRGGLMVSAILIFLSSLASGLAILAPGEGGTRWRILLGVRVVNGIGMGIKAVSAPILASETAIRFWRGSLLLHWQLWVACGIAVGLIINLIIVQAAGGKDALALALILGFPLVPSIFLFISLFWCQESPRYYMRGEKISYNPIKAYAMLKRLKGCDVLAQRDIYVLYKAIESEHKILGLNYPPDKKASQEGDRTGLGTRFIQLFTRQRLRNAIISTATVNLAQQLCGINFSQFYSGPFFSDIIQNKDPDQSLRKSMDQNHLKLAIGLSIIFGGINFIFGWPAMKTIDTLGRRKWLITTLPLMTFFMLGATLTAIASRGDEKFTTRAAAIIAVWLYLHAIVYSPSLGPIPFTLASESFPLPHRELGCAFALSVNLFFAGVLSLVVPFMLRKFEPEGTMGFFTGTNLLAFIMVFFLVEETTELSLEALNARFGHSKLEFARKRGNMLVSLFKRHVFGIKSEPKPENNEMDQTLWEFNGFNLDTDESRGPSPRTSESRHDVSGK